MKTMYRQESTTTLKNNCCSNNTNYTNRLTDIFCTIPVRLFSCDVSITIIVS